MPRQASRWIPTKAASGGLRDQLQTFMAGWVAAKNEPRKQNPIDRVLTDLRDTLRDRVDLAKTIDPRSSPGQGASARKAHALAVLRGAPGGTRTPDPQIRSLGARVPPSPITSQRASWHWRLPASPSLRVPLNPTRSQGPWPQRGHKIPPGLGGGAPDRAGDRVVPCPKRSRRGRAGCGGRCRPTLYLPCGAGVARTGIGKPRSTFPCGVGLGVGLTAS